MQLSRGNPHIINVCYIKNKIKIKKGIFKELLSRVAKENWYDSFNTQWKDSNEDPKFL